MFWALLTVAGIFILFGILVIGTSRRVSYDRFAAVIRICVSCATILLSCILFVFAFVVTPQPGPVLSYKIRMTGFAVLALGWAIPQLRRGIVALRRISPVTKA
jgi:hypothetical protein